MTATVPTQEEFLAYQAKVDTWIRDCNVNFQKLTVDIEALKAKVAVLEAGNTTVPEPELMWAEDFSGPAVSGSKWNVRNNTYSSNEESILTNRPVNVGISAGNLSIMAQKESFTVGSTTRKFTSGYLDTIRKQSFRYGRFEMRAKLPTQKDTSRGMWPAFWLRPDDGGNGEIDIMECLGSAKNDTEYNKVHLAIHHDYLSSSDPRHIQHENNGGFTLPNGGVTSDWHVYGLDWREDHLVWYVDDQIVWSRTPDTTPWFAEVFRKPYNIRLNLQVGGTWAKTPDADTKFPGEYLVDYIRYYE